ncbi:AAA family ATPase [Salipaludibacillus sp. HK11]|uniref:AAA family ATPase n=1 Tax=Salipaludibacillus sp. HK11 TaxID=3394320 RepID=UPI0039FDCBCF
MTELRALIITKDEETRQKLCDHLEKKQMIAVSENDWSEEFLQQGYNLIFVDEAFVEMESTLWTASQTYIIILTKQKSFDQVRDLMKFGIYDVLLPEEEDERVVDIINHLHDKLNQEMLLASTGDSFNSRGNVLVFYSSKGGAGKSILATLSSQCLQTQHDKKVALLDLNAQFGGIDVLMGLDHQRSYYDLKPVLEELAIHHIHNIAVTHEETGVDVILGPSNPEQAEEMEDELISRMIRVLKEHYDYVLIDMPSQVSSLSFTGLNEASHIYYVVTPDSLSLRALKHSLALFDRFQIGKKQGLSLILNRTGKKDEMTEADVKKIIDIPVEGNIRADYYGIQPMLNMGIPFFLPNGKKAKSKVTKDIDRFVEKQIVPIIKK